jgi:hypothetical protein
VQRFFQIVAAVALAVLATTASAASCPVSDTDTRSLEAQLKTNPGDLDALVDAAAYACRSMAGCGAVEATTARACTKSQPCDQQTAGGEALAVCTTAQGPGVVRVGFDGTHLRLGVDLLVQP